MTDKQKASFSERAQELFSWKEPDLRIAESENLVSCNTIVLAIFPKVTKGLLNKLVKMIEHYSDNTWGSIDIVFHCDDLETTKFSENRF